MAKPSDSATKRRQDALAMAIDLIKAALSQMSALTPADLTNLTNETVSMAGAFEDYIVNGLQEPEEE